VYGDVTELATDGLNKIAIDWDEPMGPADGGYGGGQDNDSNHPFLFAPKARHGRRRVRGTLRVLRRLSRRHRGASTQAAEVWNSVEGTYTVSYSHDAQPRH
jgi:hypothetical protein